jgi:hypothetical protein
MFTRHQKASFAIAAVAISVLAGASTASAGPIAGLFSYGGPAGLFPVNMPAGLINPGQSRIYNMGRPGTTVCGMGRCKNGGLPAGLLRR